MRIKPTFYALLALFLISGCAASYNTNFPLVEKRMSFSKVSELLGKPISAQAGPGDTKIYFYRLASSPLDTDGSDTREYWVQLKDGEVIGYGERTDTATLIRQARQFEAAWSSVRSLNEVNKALVETNTPSPSPTPVNTNCTQFGNTTRCQSN
jgi:hypothetical protein